MTASTPEPLAAPILVVEDSVEDFDTLREAAAAAGVTRMACRVMSGGDCLAMLRGQGGTALPQLPALNQAGANAYHVKPARHDQYLLLPGSLFHYWLDSVTLHVVPAKVN